MHSSHRATARLAPYLMPWIQVLAFAVYYDRMKSYAVLLRGVNVGGKNKIPMAALKERLQKTGFQDVTTYIQSGNVIVRSDRDPATIGSRVEAVLTSNFRLDSSIVKVLVLTYEELHAIVENRPKAFGSQPEKYHYDVIFLMDYDVTEALAICKTREGVDRLWAANGVIYFERLSSLRTKSRMSAIVGTLAYQSMTIRNWNTTTKLLALLQEGGNTLHS
jgi:uncharacterized protein (DUF1697 family)